jgi:hypothetical protein
LIIDQTVSFVQKTVEYCQQNPDLVPPFLNVDELSVDVQAVVEFGVRN